MTNKPIHTARVSRTTNATSLASCIVARLSEGKAVDLTAFGPEAMIVANKALAIARLFALDNSMGDITFIPSMQNITDDAGIAKCMVIWRAEI